jgi:hypothetical protein
MQPQLRCQQQPEGCQNVDPSCCGEVVFVQEAAESVASREFRVWGWRRWRRVREWWVAAECAVWALGVVVVYVDAEDAVEVARSEDQQPVQALRPCGPHEALGVRVGLWRSERRFGPR